MGLPLWDVHCELRGDLAKPTLGILAFRRGVSILCSVLDQRPRSPSAWDLQCLRLRIRDELYENRSTFELHYYRRPGQITKLASS